MTNLFFPITGHTGLEGKELHLEQLMAGATSKESVSKHDETGIQNDNIVIENDDFALDTNPAPDLEDEISFEGYVPPSPKPGTSHASHPYVEPQNKRPRLLYVEPQKENIIPTTVGNGEHYFVLQYLFRFGGNSFDIYLRYRYTWGCICCIFG